MFRRQNNKFHNQKVGGYDSRKERRRAQELKFLAERGIISDLQEQVKFELIPAQYEEVVQQLKTKSKVVKRCVERSCCYIADFVYRDPTGKLVVEDVKSPITRTPEYRIKRKLMLWVKGIKIKEV